MVPRSLLLLPYRLCTSIPAANTTHEVLAVRSSHTGFLYREEFSLGFKVTAPDLLKEIYYVCTCVYVYQ